MIKSLMFQDHVSWADGWLWVSAPPGARPRYAYGGPAPGTAHVPDEPQEAAEVLAHDPQHPNNTQLGPELSNQSAKYPQRQLWPWYIGHWKAGSWLKHCRDKLCRIICVITRNYVKNKSLSDLTSCIYQYCKVLYNQNYISLQIKLYF